MRWFGAPCEGYERLYTEHGDYVEIECNGVARFNRGLCERCWQ